MSHTCCSFIHPVLEWALSVNNSPYHLISFLKIFKLLASTEKGLNLLLHLLVISTTMKSLNLLMVFLIDLIRLSLIK